MSLFANQNLVLTGDLTTQLWRIGAVEETLKNIQEMREQGRGLNAVNSLLILWNTYNRTNLSDPALPAFFESSGMADYWRKHGNPDYCRVNTDNSILCGDS